jgi:hypothetical protein
MSNGMKRHEAVLDVKIRLLTQVQLLLGLSKRQDLFQRFFVANPVNSF